MIFNLDLTKQAQEVIFSRKTKKLLFSCLSFNGIPLKNGISQKHTGLTLDVKLNFVQHIEKISKTMGLLRRFKPILPRSSLLAIYKTFIKSQTLLMPSATKFITPLFMRNLNLFNNTMLAWE